MRGIADISMFESLGHSSGVSSMNSLSVFNYSGNPIINMAAQPSFNRTHRVTNAEVEPMLPGRVGTAVRTGLSTAGGLGAAAAGGVGGLIGSQATGSLSDMARRIVDRDPETINSLIASATKGGMPNPAMLGGALALGIPATALLTHQLVTKKDGFSRRGSWRRTLSNLIGQLGGGGLGVLGSYGLNGLLAGSGLAAVSPFLVPLLFGLGSSLGGAFGQRRSAHANYVRAMRESERVLATAGIKQFGEDHYLMKKLRDLQAIRSAFKLGRLSRREYESAFSRSWFDNDFFVPNSPGGISGN